MVNSIYEKFSVRGKVWKYPGAGGWHFIYIDKKISNELKKKKLRKVGLGYIPVKVKLGKTEWNTTLFPSKEGPYLLSIKADVRKREGILEGDSVEITCAVIS